MTVSFVNGLLIDVRVATSASNVHFSQKTRSPLKIFRLTDFVANVHTSRINFLTAVITLASLTTVFLRLCFISVPSFLVRLTTNPRIWPHF